MTKDGLVEAILSKFELASKKQAKEIVDTIFETITNTLARGEEVAISGFGTFRVARRAAREGINPRTGEKIQIPASIKPKFRASKALKEAIK
ncbi:MAG TPA: HU family DNA-binding protein [Candidatus Paceibacterota bacterium]|nr:HU family DNA-binding protein [Candidatus Paceibacterota bacterium]HOL53896.1 HU family DNA-binding protein [Candidatus Paceibacterota bacterium]HON21686.1 HU family DNA-binding protein [Candidatus Paceibacterota bacterium]HOV88800.1 HU family DNA-binding protein [Candidatus Paceibacterota bacterium]HPP17185.1 HU family DNA-binding protein [Candidatus Paceibacterota bacterium]